MDLGSVLVNGYDLFLKCVLMCYSCVGAYFIDGSVSANVSWWQSERKRGVRKHA